MSEPRVSDSISKLLIDVTVPTEEKQPQVIVAPETIVVPPENANTASNSSPETNTLVQQPQTVKPPVTDEMVENGAELVIGMFDFSQNNLFKFFVNRKKNNRMEALLGENHKDKLETLISNVESGKKAEEFKPEDLSALRLEKDVQTLLKDLPLSDQEKESLKKPLMAIMKAKGGVIPPEYLLILAILQIAGGRTAETVML
ncbi:MAG: hypothetical protein KGZ81_12260 [Flavobacteriales bacterium]|nr:hypothetical protein [Flavobacteriales bacterium]